MQIQLSIILVIICIFTFPAYPLDYSTVEVDPYAYLESKFLTTESKIVNQNVEVSHELYHTNTLNFGINAMRNPLYTSIGGVIIHNENEFKKIGLDATLGFGFKNFLFYLGTLNDFNSLEDMKILNTTYAGISAMYEKDLMRFSFNGQYQIAKFPELIGEDSNNNNMVFSAKTTLKRDKFTPFLKLTMEKWNFYDDMNWNLSIGLALFGEPRLGSESPKYFKLLPE